MALRSAALFGLAYYVIFAPDLLLYAFAFLLLLATGFILMNLERGEIEIANESIRLALRIPLINILAYILVLPLIWRPSERYEVRQARIWTSGLLALTALCWPLYFLLDAVAIETNVRTLGIGYFLGLLISLILVAQLGVSRIVAEESADVGEPLAKKAMRRIRNDRLTLLAIFTMFVVLVISMHTAFLTERLMGVTYFTTSAERTFQPIPMFCGTGIEFDQNGRADAQPCREEHPNYPNHLLGTG